MSSSANNPLLLLATGSIASVKFPALVELLTDYSPDCWLTNASTQWCPRDAVTTARVVEDNETAFLAAIQNADTIIISPASASALARLAHGLGKHAQAVKQKRVIVAPAMNMFMWNHPATQRNVVVLQKSGVRFLGPVAGGLACGDEGLGRFMEPAMQADAIHAALQNKSHEAFTLIEKALIPTPQLPTAAPEQSGRITLWVGANALHRDIENATHAMKAKGLEVAIVAPLGFAPVEGARVTTRHYEHDAAGFEHIRLSQHSDALLLVNPSGEEIQALQQGRAESFLQCVYLAARVPVKITGNAGALAADGVKAVTMTQFVEGIHGR